MLKMTWRDRVLGVFFILMLLLAVFLGGALIMLGVLRLPHPATIILFVGGSVAIIVGGGMAALIGYDVRRGVFS